MKTSPRILALLLLWPLAAPAQAPAPAAPAPATPAAPAPAAPANSVNLPGDSVSSTLDTLYGRKPAEGTTAEGARRASDALADKLKALDILSSSSATGENLVPPQFESYLNSSEADPPTVERYLRTYDQIQAALADKRTIDAVQTLYQLSEFPWDAGISRQLANRVLAILEADKTVRGLMSKNDELQGVVRQTTWNADQLAESARRAAETNRRPSDKSDPSGGTPGGGGSNPTGAQSNPQTGQPPAPTGNLVIAPAQDPAATANTTIAAVMGKLRLTEEYLRTLDAKSRIQWNTFRISEMSLKAKSDFIAGIRDLHKTQRHQQVVIAADLFRMLFSDGDLPPELAQMAADSTEAIRRARDAVEVFQFKVERKQIAGASKILLDAYSLASHDPLLQGVDRSSKLLVADYLQSLRRIQNLVEARDFARLDTALLDLETRSTDFDSSKPRALVNAVKLESKLRLGKAKLAAQMGDKEKAMEEFKAAAEAWPANPDLDTAAATFFEKQDVVNQSAADFDRAIAAQNYRLVFDNQLIYLGGVHGDPAREQQLKDALEKVKNAEIAIEKANLLDRNGDPYGAWETLEPATRAWPEDSKLNKLRADLSVKASPFVTALDKGQTAEARGQTGYALNWYVAAQRVYPPSQQANQSIERLSKKVLRKD